MLNLTGALTELADLLTAAGLSAGTDPSKLNPPCAWVHSDSVQIDRLNGGATLACFIDLTVPSWNLPIALQQLNDMLNVALTVVTPDGAVELDRAVELNGGKVLPCFRIPLNLDI